LKKDAYLTQVAKNKQKQEKEALGKFYGSPLSGWRHAVAEKPRTEACSPTNSFDDANEEWIRYFKERLY